MGGLKGLRLEAKDANLSAYLTGSEQIMSIGFDRRQVLATAGFAALPVAGMSASSAVPATSFRYSLNTATIQGQNLTLDQQVAVAAKAGYQGIEPWVRDVEKFRQSGGSLSDLGKKCLDLGLAVESAIGFPEWVVPEASRRQQSLENLKKDLEGLKSLGCRRLAAPPAGATKATDIPLAAAAERFGVLARLTREFGMVAMVEVWGFSTFLNRLGDAAYIATECGSTNSAVLADIYHLYKGGSGFDGLGQLSPTGFQVFHINDYPSAPPPADITDAHRVYPGDGVAPLEKILPVLAKNAPGCVLSLELFNRDYWKRDANEVARTGLEKLKSVVARAMKTGS